MNKIYRVLFAGLILAGASFPAALNAAPPTADSVSPAAAQLCPVSGDKVKSEKFFADAEGKRYFFCCRGCQRKFKKNPSKFLAA